MAHKGSDKGWGSSLWGELQKVKVTGGTVEAPVKADGDGIRIGSSASTPPEATPEKPRRPGLLARLLRLPRRGGR